MTAREVSAHRLGTVEGVLPGKAGANQVLPGVATGAPGEGKGGTTLAAIAGHLVTQVVATDSRIVAASMSSVQPQETFCCASHDEGEFLFREEVTVLHYEVDVLLVRPKAHDDWHVRPPNQAVGTNMLH